LYLGLSNTLVSLCLLKTKFMQNLQYGILTRLYLKTNLVTTHLNKLTLHHQNIIYHSQRNVFIATITCKVRMLNLACSASLRDVLRRMSIKSSNRGERSNNERSFTATIKGFIYKKVQVCQHSHLNT